MYFHSLKKGGGETFISLLIDMIRTSVGQVKFLLYNLQASRPLQPLCSAMVAEGSGGSALTRSASLQTSFQPRIKALHTIFSFAIISLICYIFYPSFSSFRH